MFLFDAPLSNLDAKLRVQMRREIRRIHASVGATSVFVTHDQHQGMTLADRLVMMNKDRIEQIGTPEDIYDRPASAYVAGFIRSPALNILPGRISADGALVDLDDGQRIALRSGFRTAAGQLVQIGLRPEKLGFAQAGRAMLKARFDFAEELGAGRIYHMKIEDVSISLISPEKQVGRRSRDWSGVHA